ncbi:hypothetical protein K8W59_07470 [Nocardioides rotundus]|uniref:hypothetical protein n=1 Tax=Nocardioides rotundus TaxID=1774216 RepID=UPI001CBCA820|nr:hypothetical protein [Nocardioides rotundus]UAL31283.1 hypothetical protein K8W59_07470 [Nocardioides rotundus]
MDDVTGEFEDDLEEPERPQVWHDYRMSHSINVAWLGYDVTLAQMDALEDSWDRLVVLDEWRHWVEQYLIPPSPFLYLAVRDEIDKRTLRKTSDGASLNLPAAELTVAEAEGRLEDLYLGVIRDLYRKWAEKRDFPPPPDLPPSDT